MSEFGKTLDESEKRTTTRARYGSDFVKITSEHQTVVRVLDVKPEVHWSHFVPKGHHAFPNANAGKGMSFMCPGWDDCPICAWNRIQKKADLKTKDVLNARKLYTFNVLDRTSVVVCPSCEAEHYEGGGSYPSECECGANLSEVTATPRNKIQIMQKGKRIVDQFKSFEEEPELGDLKEYDVKLDTRGKLNEAVTTCVPKQKTKVDEAELFGEDWRDKLYDIKQVTSPLSGDVIKRILQGEDYYTVLSARKEEKSKEEPTP